MTTNIDEFNRMDCEKIDADCINAFVDFHYDPDNPTGICVDSSWGSNCLDLEPIVKEAETCTELYLSPEEDPNCLIYKGECDTYCINGDDLSRIISMSKLKDVDQDTPPSNGDVYMYDNGTWKTFNLQEFIDDVGTTVNNLKALLKQYDNRIKEIEAKLTPPEGAPLDVKVAFGNINMYSDSTYTGSGNFSKNSGLYTHSLNTNVTNDELFA